MTIGEGGKQVSVLRAEMACWFGFATVIVFLTVGATWLDDLSGTAWFAFVFAWLCGAILWAAFGVTKHADVMAIKLGEPYGTLLLTVAVTGMEVVMIVAVAVTAGDNPTVARDTMFSVVMIQLNALIGLTLLVGGLKHHEQFFNQQGNKAFLAAIVALSSLTIILPRFAATPNWFLAAAAVALYGTFLGIQTMRHQGYFKYQEGDGEEDEHDHHGLVMHSKRYHVLFLMLSMLPVVLLAKKFAILIDHGVGQMGAPVALGGLIIAVLVLSPEVISAIKAAQANKMQRSDNIVLGATMCTIGLTVPSVIIASYFTGKSVEFGLDDAGIFLLAVTLLISVINASAGRTNILQGVIHLVLFAAFLVTVFV